MRLVVVVDGLPELAWTWLPWWLAQSPALKQDVERVIKDAVLLNGIALDDQGLDRLSQFARKVICSKFKLPGLSTYLEGLDAVAG